MAQKPVPAWARLQRKSASLRRNFEQLLREFTELACSENCDTITGTKVTRAEIQEWKTILTSADQTAEPAIGGLERRATEALEGLEERLIRTLRNAGLSVYGETPLLVIEGIVHAEINVQKALARVNGKGAPEMSVNALEQEILVELDRVRKLATPPESFIALLLQAYEAERLQAAKVFGSQVLTSGVFWHLALLKQQPGFRANPLATNFRDYPREMFRADLFRLLESNLVSTDRKRFRYASGSDTAGAVFMLVPQLGRTAHIGRIWFEHGE